MIIRLDHIGVVAGSWDEARDVLAERFGFPLVDPEGHPDGILYEPQNTRNYFLRVGAGDTMIEVLVPQDSQSGIARYLARRGPGLHHVAYRCDDVPAETRRLQAAGFEAIEIGDMQNGVFFRPKGTLGILTELVVDGD